MDKFIVVPGGKAIGPFDRRTDAERLCEEKGWPADECVIPLVPPEGQEESVHLVVADCGSYYCNSWHPLGAFTNAVVAEEQAKAATALGDEDEVVRVREAAVAEMTLNSKLSLDNIHGCM